MSDYGDMYDGFDDRGQDDFNDFEIEQVHQDMAQEDIELEHELEEAHDAYQDDMDGDRAELDDDFLIDPSHSIRNEMFADPTGRSALRAETADNPRNLSCPTCERPNCLTPKDKALGYQCDQCADELEGCC